MIKIRELLKIDVLEDITLLGENIWHDNEIDSIGILDYEAIENQYSLFRMGDFVLTTLMFAREDPELAEEALINLMKQRVSAIAIKSIYFNCVTEKVQAYADQHKIQLIVFDDIAFEDIIISVSDEMRNKEFIKYCEIRVNELISPHRGNDYTLKKLNEINSSFLESSICAFCTPVCLEKSGNQKLIDKIMKNVRSRKTKGINSIHNAVFRYRDGIFIMHTYDKSLFPKGDLEVLLKDIGLYQEVFRIGKSRHKLSLEKMLCGISEALASNAYGVIHDSHCIGYGGLGIDQLLLPLSDNNWVLNYSKSLLDKIKVHDEKSTYKLYPTVIEYIKHRGELKKTAESVDQHVNTIRYRLNKVREIIGYNEENNDFYEQLFLAVKIEMLRS